METTDSYSEVRIVGLADDGVAMATVGLGDYRYTFVLAPSAPNGLWTETLLTTYLAGTTSADNQPPFVQMVSPGRLTATFSEAGEMQGQLDFLHDLVSRTNAAYRERYPPGCAELEAERAYWQAQQEKSRPARVAAQRLHF